MVFVCTPLLVQAQQTSGTDSEANHNVLEKMKQLEDLGLLPENDSDGELSPVQSGVDNNSLTGEFTVFVLGTGIS